VQRDLVPAIWLMAALDVDGVSVDHCDYLAGRLVKGATPRGCRHLCVWLERLAQIRAVAVEGALDVET
jgi:hypothetical protein